MASQEVSPPNSGAIDEVAPVLASLPEIPHAVPEPKLSVAEDTREDPTPSAPPVVAEVPVPKIQITKSSLGLALNLVLNEIALQARMTTTATGAVIGLESSGGLEGAAMTGASAPEVAACLNLRPGIAADCFHSGTVGRADDIAADTQADFVAYRRSGLRCMLVVPVSDEKGRSLGILEIFSPRPNAFSDRDVLTLQALARRIAANVELVRKGEAASSTEVNLIPTPPSPLTNAERGQQKPEPRVRGLRSRSILRMKKSPAVPPGVKKTLRKTASILAVLVAICGVGRLGWMQVRDNYIFKPHPSTVDASTSIEAGVSKPVSAIPPNQVEAAIDVYVRPETLPTKASRSRVSRPNIMSSIAIDRKPISRPASGVPNVASMVPATGDAALSAHMSSGKVLQQEPERKDSTAGNPGVEVLTTETAMQMLVQRIEPEYPNAARRQHIQGTVMLDVVVNAEGGVDEVSPVSGESQLMNAATTAVQQWRFQPLLKGGKPKSFKSRIAIDFTLATNVPQGL